MRHILRNSIFCIALLLIAVWAVTPPETKLRLGKDLRGGTTLVYSVNLGPGGASDAQGVLNQTIRVLKDRVDPTGLLEIQLVAQGRDRIEITMPLPGEQTRALRAAFESELATLAETGIDAADVDEAMASADRAGAIARLAGRATGAEAVLTEAAARWDAFRALRARYDELAGSDATASEALDAVASAVAEAQLAYEAARAEVLRPGLSPQRVRRALLLATDQKVIIDEGAADDASRRVTLPSPRERAIEAIKAEHPDLAARVDAVAAAWAAYESKREGLDDPEELKRLVQAAGVPAFRITVDPASRGMNNAHPDEAELRAELREKGPRNAGARDARWCRINKPDQWFDTTAQFEAMNAAPSAYFAERWGLVVEPYAGEYWALCWDAKGKRLSSEDGAWSVARAFRTQDQTGRPAIGFAMDARGAVKLGDLTQSNVGNNMAVLLDEEVYTAPRLNSRISSNGVIEGGSSGFTDQEIEYVVKVLTAGSLQAKLSPEPVSEATVAPEFGQDNLDAGKSAGLIALVAVSAFMVVYYFAYGAVAVVGLLFTAVMIVAAMALSRAAFTLPGIAGVILTFGMAVDANVLIYERIREELRRGEDLRASVRTGYAKALSSIVDGNVTTLIVCFVLANPALGTQEIRGFATTLGIGVVCTMFSALFVSRLLLAVLVDGVKLRRMAMLPMAAPIIERALEPKIDWMGLRWVSIFVSGALLSLGATMVVVQGESMFDAEFRGGTQVDLRLRPAPEGYASDVSRDGRATLTRADVEAKVRAIGAARPEGDALQALRSAEVIPVNPEPGGVRSDRFVVKTYATDQEGVLEAIVSALGEEIESRPPLRFRGESIEAAPEAEGLVAPVLSGRLGDALGRPALRQDVTPFIGGVAVLIEDIEPAPTRANLIDRLLRVREGAAFSDTLGREVELVVISGGDESVRSAVLLVRDDGASYFENADVWRSDLAAREWALVRDALTRVAVPASVQSFSPVVAEGFKQQAIVSVVLSLMLILIYIWVRFGSARYSAAAIAALLHDVLAMIGLIAVAEVLYENTATQPVAQALGIEPFKIDLNLVAAVLTVIGYSLNDTIIIMDRIRENRGKLPYATREAVNLSINQTVSRTVITSGTTLLATVVLYAFGGSGVRAFSYALLCGIGVGTYSSIAIAAPMVWSRRSQGPTGNAGGSGRLP